MLNTQVGIHDISLATTSLLLDLGLMAARMGIDAQKYYQGIGQVEMSVPCRDEDIVTLAANAAWPIIKRHGNQRIRNIILATESGIDQSKAASVYVHQLLGLAAECRAIEFKQACYSATAALQYAAAIVHRYPDQQVLVIASDIARYDLHSSGEPTQGAGAIAMLISAKPAMLALDLASGVYTDDIMDFWRPNHRDTAIVDGKSSIRAYLHAMERAWHDAQQQGAYPFSEIDYFCYHQPFTAMALKAHRHLLKVVQLHMDAGLISSLLEPTLIYNRHIGNSYTASLYSALLSLLDHSPQLAGKRIGFFSYGSGCVAETFTGIVQEGYETQLRTEQHAKVLAQRKSIDDAEYRQRHTQTLPTGDGEYMNPKETLGLFRFKGLSASRRQYERTF